MSHKCPHCDCLFFTQTDLAAHLKAFGTRTTEHQEHYTQLHRAVDVGDEYKPKSPKLQEIGDGWLKGLYGNQIKPVKKDPLLARNLSSSWQNMGNYDYKLSRDWIVRRRSN